MRRASPGPVPIIKVESDFARCQGRSPAERDHDQEGKAAQGGEEGTMDGQPGWPGVGKTGQLPHTILIEGAHDLKRNSM